jgi:hypothetical protein
MKARAATAGKTDTQPKDAARREQQTGSFMSRRAKLFVLATSAALIATQASAADTKCVGASCATAPTEAQLRAQSPSTRGEGQALRHRHFRHLHNGYVVGAPVAFAPMAVASPPYVYGGYGYYGYGAYVGRPVYLFAPNAKIIKLDRD